MVVAPGRMIDSCLSIPDAESLPLFRMVLKPACVWRRANGMGNNHNNIDNNNNNNNTRTSFITKVITITIIIRGGGCSWRQANGMGIWGGRGCRGGGGGKRGGWQGAASSPRRPGPTGPGRLPPRRAARERDRGGPLAVSRRAVCGTAGRPWHGGPSAARRAVPAAAASIAVRSQRAVIAAIRAPRGERPQRSLRERSALMAGLSYRAPAATSALSWRAAAE
jgi:hypothetical protein